MPQIHRTGEAVRASRNRGMRFFRAPIYDRAASAATWPANEVTKVSRLVMPDSVVKSTVLATVRGVAITEAVV